MGTTADVPVLVTGTGNLALGALRVFGRQGIPVFAGDHAPGLERGSRWYEPVPGGWRPGTLEENLHRIRLERAVLIPTSEAGAIAAASLPPELERRFPSSTPGPDLLRAFADKEGQSALLQKHGVPIPRTWPIGGPDDLAQIDDRAIEHVFLKPRDSGRFSARFGRKSFRPKGREALRDTLRSLREAGFEMIAQEYVPGPARNSYLIDGFVDRHGVVSGVFARRRVRQYPLDFGNSSAVRSIPREEVAEFEPVVLDFLRSIGYRGIFNAEFKRDPRDGSFRLFEINPRTWLYAEFAARCGFDALTMAYLDALERPVPECETYATGRTVVYGYHDLHACLESRKRGAMTAGDAVRSWLDAEQLVYTRDDPRPLMVAIGALVAGFVGRRLPWR